jgi:hypothetical protein
MSSEITEIESPAVKPIGDYPEMVSHEHVESEATLRSILYVGYVDYCVTNFFSEEQVKTQRLSWNPLTGEGTYRVQVPAGWSAPIGSFSADLEMFVLEGHVEQGGYPLRKHSYAFIPEGIVTGPWIAKADTTLLFMPDAELYYDTARYQHLPQDPKTSLFHVATQEGTRFSEYIPAKEIYAMNWENMTLIPSGSARKSLYSNPVTGRATWIAGLVPGWGEGNFLAGHPTTEEAYLIKGDISGWWCMADDPFNRRFATMTKDGYFRRPAHVPHGPFTSEDGALLLFRTKSKLGCNWILHSSDINQMNPVA